MIVSLHSRRGGRSSPQRCDGLRDHAFRHHPRAVAAVHGQVGALRTEPVAPHRVVPAELAGEHPRIGVDQELVRVEAMAARSDRRGRGHGSHRAGRGTGPRHRRARYCRSARQLDAGDFALAGAFEQAEFDRRRMLRKQRKVDALAVPGRTEWERLAVIDAVHEEGSRDGVLHRPRSVAQRTSPGGGSGGQYVFHPIDVWSKSATTPWRCKQWAVSRV